MQIKHIRYYAKNQYGLIRHFIFDQEVANAYCKLTGRLTLDLDHIPLLQAFGCTFEAVMDPATHQASK